jgi:hypothetical protein
VVEIAGRVLVDGPRPVGCQAAVEERVEGGLVDAIVGGVGGGLLVEVDAQ